MGTLHQQCSHDPVGTPHPAPLSDQHRHGESPGPADCRAPAQRLHGQNMPGRKLWDYSNLKQDPRIPQASSTHGTKKVLEYMNQTQQIMYSEH